MLTPIRAGGAVFSLFLLNVLTIPSVWAYNWCNQQMNAAVEPRVLQYGQTSGTVRFTLRTYPDPTSMEVRLFSGGTVVPVTHQPNGTWTFEVSMAKALAGYQLGMGRNYFGRLYQYEGTTEIAGYTNLQANVWDSTMPLVAIRNVAAGQAQMTRHVLNMRDDNTYYWGATPVGPPAAFFQRFYTYRPDDYDFLAVVGENLAFENRYFVGLRNDTQGLGASLFNNGAAFGSPSRLQGYVNYPNDNFFDLAEAGLSHELAHRWCCFLDMPTLGTAHQPHWPMGDIAYGIMGITDPDSKQGLQFSYTLTPQPGGTYKANATDPASEFNDMELYLMGLLPANEVGNHFIFNNQSQTPGGTMQGPVTNFGVNEIVAKNGQRFPAYRDSQKAFRLASIVLSRGRLMEPYEMALFEYMAARGESTAALPGFSGVMPTTSKPFYLATKTKATLSTTVCNDCAGAATTVSAASFATAGNLAPDSIVSAFGFGLTDAVRIASSTPLPTMLGNTSVRVTDSGGAQRTSSLFFTSQGQINFLFPAGTASGNATVDVLNNGQAVASGQVTVGAVAPGLFTANTDGAGAPAANVIRVVNSVATYESLAAQCGSTWGSCTPKQIDLGPSSNEVFLEMYGTGIRGRSSLGAVTCTIGGVTARVDYAGTNPYFAGLDQVNVLIPRGLIGRGLVDLILTVDGKAANTVKVNIK